MISDPTGFIDCSEDRTRIHLRVGGPTLDRFLDPSRHGSGSDVHTFAAEVRKNPVILPLQETSEMQRGQLRAPESAAQKNSDHCVVTLATKTVPIEHARRPLALERGQPVSKTDSMLFAPFTRRIPAARSGLSKPQSAAS